MRNLREGLTFDDKKNSNEMTPQQNHKKHRKLHKLGDHSSESYGQNFDTQAKVNVHNFIEENLIK